MSWFKEIIPTELGRISSPTKTLNNQGPLFTAQLDGMAFDPSWRVMFCFFWAIFGQDVPKVGRHPATKIFKNQRF